MTSVNKQPFLVVYDYGSGGLWGVVLAGSAEEIQRVYPELEVVPELPKWMTQDYYADLAATPYDVDGAPWGLLNALLADRERE